MGLTKLTSIAGEAEVLGQVRRIQWSDMGGHLSIEGLTLAEAYDVLNRLALGALPSVKLPRAAQEQTAQPVERTAPPPVPPKDTMVPLATKEQVKEAVAKPEEKKEVAPPKVNGAAKTATVDPSKLSGFTSLGEVVVFLYEQGATSVDALAAQCAALKSDVPLLGRIQNLDERVRRAYEVKGLGQQEPA